MSNDAIAIGMAIAVLLAASNAAFFALRAISKFSAWEASLRPPATVFRSNPALTVTSPKINA